MGSSTSRSNNTRQQTCGCFHGKPKRWHRNLSHQEGKDSTAQNQNQNRNQSQNIPHQPDLHNNNATELLELLNFKVIKLKAVIDKRLTTTDEKSNAVLKYRTPHFRALATVEIPVLESKQSVQIGWIQTCVNMRFVNQYGNEGATSWEFPEIVTGKYKMISDADGKMYPWYGSKHEVQTVRGPTVAPQPITIHMNDNFFPQVTWYIPFNQYDRSPRLSHIHRKQKFYTFLVAKNLEIGEYHILRTISWSMELNIEVDVSNPLGKRAKLMGPLEQDAPVILPENSVDLFDYSMKPPNANNSQSLVWRPRIGDPSIIVPPVETTVDMDRYIQATRNFKVASLAERRNSYHKSES